MIDCHVHTNHSGDADSSLFEMCEKAVTIGIAEIGFADHLDFTPTDSCYQTFHYQNFMDDAARAREAFGDRLIIRTGLEVDYQVRYHDQIIEWLDGKSFDYLIGSAHYVDGILLEEHEKYFPGKTMLGAYSAFFDVAEALVRSGLFDVAAHLDLCKRYGTI